MDALRNYPGFEGDIKDSFKEIIEDYHFTLFGEGIYVLSNNKCVIKITYDRGDVSCNFIIPETDEVRGYPAWVVGELLHPDDPLFKEHTREYNARAQLFAYAYLIKEKLTNVLKGDFSWIAKYKQKQKEDYKYLYFMNNTIDQSHPLFKKFCEGNSYWKEDLIKYLAVNNIEL